MTITITLHNYCPDRTFAKMNGRKLRVSGMVEWDLTTTSWNIFTSFGWHEAGSVHGRFRDMKDLAGEDGARIL